MFSKLKQVKDLRSQAKTMQSALAEESATAEKHGVKVKVDGNMKIIDIQIPEGLDNAKIAAATKDATNDAIKQVQKIMAQKMQQMGGFPGMN